MVGEGGACRYDGDQWGVRGCPHRGIKNPWQESYAEACRWWRKGRGVMVGWMGAARRAQKSPHAGVRYRSPPVKLTLSLTTDDEPSTRGRYPHPPRPVGAWVSGSLGQGRGSARGSGGQKRWRTGRQARAAARGSGRHKRVVARGGGGRVARRLGAAAIRLASRSGGGWGRRWTGGLTGAQQA